MSKSIFPPDIITITVLLVISILLVNAAVAATAPPGSTIIFKCSAKNFIDFLTSSSLTTIPPKRLCRLIGNVNFPGCGVIIASQIEVSPTSLEIIFF